MRRASRGHPFPTVLLGALLGSPACGGTAEQEVACGPAGTCGGTESCFAICYCRSLDSAACADDCALANDDPLTLAVPEPEVAVVELERELHAAIDAARAMGGACDANTEFAPTSPLEPNADLTLAARRHARDMVLRGYFGHESPEGLRVIDRVRAAGYRGCAVGENLASGRSAPARVLADWLASAGHCANLLTGDYAQAGVALDASGTEPVWVLVLGGSGPADPS